jgi:hypothetical protein
MNLNLKEFARALGVIGDADSRFRLGPGLVGNNSSIVRTFLIVAAVLGYFLRDQPLIDLSAIGLLAGVAVLTCIGNLIYAHLHPDHALMEGADLLAFHQLQAGARDQAIIIDQPPIAGGSRHVVEQRGDV